MQVQEAKVIITGAGTSSLAAAACLKTSSIPYIILERDECVASLWAKRGYDRLKLHLRNQICHLPYVPYPPTYPTYVPRDLFLHYLNDYVSRFQIQPLYCRTVECAAFHVGECNARNTSGGLRSGNSSMEFSLDLAEHGAKTSVIVRSPVHLLTREMTYLFGFLFKYLPLRVVEFLYVMLSRLVSEDMTKYGIPRPPEGPFATKVKYGKFSMIDVGTCKKIKTGEIQDDSLLNDDGFAKQGNPNHWKGKNGLYCVGLSRRGFRGANRDAENVAKDIKSLL